jgi:hypothetical protein
MVTSSTRRRPRAVTFAADRWWRFTDLLGFHRPPGYLKEPDYYRLAYQLLSTRANRLATATRQDDVDRAIADASRLREQVRGVLDYFEKRRAPRWLPFWRPLDSQQRRLRRFLATTVEPCVVLGLGTLEVMRQGHEGVARAWAELERHPPGAVLRRSGRLPWRRPMRLAWSPRALFNLACLDGMTVKYAGAPVRRWPRDLCRLTGASVDPRAKPREVVAGVWALEQALRRSQGDQRTMLLHDIVSDPTLAPLREHHDARTDIQQLVDRYAPPAAAAGGEVRARQRRVWWRPIREDG